MVATGARGRARFPLRGRRRPARASAVAKVCRLICGMRPKTSRSMYFNLGNFPFAPTFATKA